MTRTTWIRRGAIAVVGVLVIGAVAVGVNRWMTTSETTVYGEFADANTLAVGNTVRAGGVEVGQVTSVGLENGHARVGLQVDPQLLPLHQDATMTIRAVNLLGEKYVELSSGSPGAPVADDDTVPMQRTKVSVDIQDVINGLGDPAATGLSALVTTAGEGLDKQGPQLAATIKALEPAFSQTNQLAGLLRDQNTALNQLVDRVGPVADSLADDNGATLDHLVGNTQQTLSTVAVNQQDVDATLAQLPATVTSARKTLGELAGTADAATPTLASIRPVTDNLPQIAGELKDFSDAADPALSSLKPVLEKGDDLLGQAQPLVAQLRQGGPDLRSTAANAKPVASQLLDQNLRGVLDFVKLWAMSTNGSDGLSHYFRGVAYATPQNFGRIATGFIPNQPPGPLQLPLRPAPQPSSTPTGADPGNATGLSPQQEQGMVGQLLGGQ
ncbi:MlaD family protein [Actinomycetospora endophytica]|uniref:MlaD family protein n=1 Tax=Actinomycetospora endophytica TaxID=2291215 RepID=A0ABS8P8G4_9PSEU|nr:MlaD family protein [Actinomycetospora endophytica]MCD2194567.1 MlaD family protein [Actinomycetospora endophytica]